MQFIESFPANINKKNIWNKSKKINLFSFNVFTRFSCAIFFFNKEKLKTNKVKLYLKLFGIDFFFTFWGFSWFLLRFFRNSLQELLRGFYGFFLRYFICFSRNVSLDSSAEFETMTRRKVGRIMFCLTLFLKASFREESSLKNHRLQINTIKVVQKSY